MSHLPFMDFSSRAQKTARGFMTRMTHPASAKGDKTVLFPAPLVSSGHGWAQFSETANVHVLYLVGFKNKFSVLLQWFWSYLFAKRGSRLITSREWKLDA